MFRSFTLPVVTVALSATLVASADAVSQVVVSTDGEDVVITRLDGTGSQRVNVAFGFPLGEPYGAMANAHHAYVRRGISSPQVIEVDLQTGQKRELFLLPCCVTAVAVSDDDRTLFVGFAELEHYEMVAYALPEGAREYTVPLPRRPQRIFFDGQRVLVASPNPLSNNSFLLTIIEDANVVAEHEIPGDIIDFVYVGGAEDGDGSEDGLSGGGDGGCAISRGSTSPLGFLLLLPAMMVVFMRRRSLAAVAVYATVGILAVPGSAAAKVFADGATMQIDGGDPVNILQPNGPALARPTPSGGGAGGPPGIEDDALNEIQLFDASTTPSVTYEVELALNVQRNWRPWFNDDVQLLINYLAGTFEAINATLQRDASVRVVIVHIQIWFDMDPGVPDTIAGLQPFLETFWSDIDRDTGITLSFGDGSGSEGSAWIGLLCGPLAYAWVSWGADNDLTIGNPWQTTGNKMHSVHSVAHELTHVLGSPHGNEYGIDVNVVDGEGTAIWEVCDRVELGPNGEHVLIETDICPAEHFGTYQSFCRSCCLGGLPPPGGPCDRPYYNHLLHHQACRGFGCWL